jgi:hypothetical protein
MKSRVLTIAFGAVLLVVGVGVAVSSEVLVAMCRSGCWFNGLLYAFLGEHHGKFLLGTLWCFAGAWFIYRGVFGRHTRHNDRDKSAI